MSDLSLLQLLVPLKTKVGIAVLTGDHATYKQSQNRPNTLGLDARYLLRQLSLLTSVCRIQNQHFRHLQILVVNPCGLGPPLSSVSRVGR